jgi:5'-3' exonuclease
MSSQFILIDGRNCVWRHQAVNDHLTRSTDGRPTGGIYGCLNSMISLHQALPEAGIVWCWDGKGDTWRHKFMQKFPQLDSKRMSPDSEIDDEEDEEDDPLGKLSREWLSTSTTLFEAPKKEKKRGYKANRHHPENDKKKGKKPEWPETPRERALIQIPVLKAILEGCGIRSYEIDELECDDLLAMIAKKIIKLDDDSEVYIHSGDKDYYQLLDWKQIRIVTRLDKGKLVKVKAQHVEEEYSVKPRHWAKYEALTGGHNNVSHLRNIGSVRAKQMLAEGIDPSKKECPQIDEKWAKFFPHGIEVMWPALHGNYKLCRLVDDPKDELLSKEVRAVLAPMFDHLDHVKRLYRASKGKTPEAYRRVGFLLSQYEMNSILARRDSLWSIP